MKINTSKKEETKKEEKKDKKKKKKKIEKRGKTKNELIEENREKRCK